ncbi:MAG: hypothetical protein ARM1_0006 [Candidatus Micrarchaeota archaeon]|nr:MAG: hypothetical protein ARM1_0006 [Candidatus Micrarchaeota archaeon]
MFTKVKQIETLINDRYVIGYVLHNGYLHLFNEFYVKRYKIIGKLSNLDYKIYTKEISIGDVLIRFNRFYSEIKDNIAEYIREISYIMPDIYFRSVSMLLSSYKYINKAFKIRILNPFILFDSIRANNLDIELTGIKDKGKLYDYSIDPFALSNRAVANISTIDNIGSTHRLWPRIVIYDNELLEIDPLRELENRISYNDITISRSIFKGYLALAKGRSIKRLEEIYSNKSS